MIDRPDRRHAVAKVSQKSPAPSIFCGLMAQAGVGIRPKSLALRWAQSICAAEAKINKNIEKMTKKKTTDKRTRATRQADAINTLATAYIETLHQLCSVCEGKKKKIV